VYVCLGEMSAQKKSKLKCFNFGGRDPNAKYVCSAYFEFSDKNSNPDWIENSEYANTLKVNLKFILVCWQDTSKHESTISSGEYKNIPENSKPTFNVKSILWPEFATTYTHTYIHTTPAFQEARAFIQNGNFCFQNALGYSWSYNFYSACVATHDRRMDSINEVAYVQSELKIAQPVSHNSER
jgi:hypothetical protein